MPKKQIIFFRNFPYWKKESDENDMKEKMNVFEFWGLFLWDPTHILMERSRVNTIDGICTEVNSNSLEAEAAP